MAKKQPRTSTASAVESKKQKPEVAAAAVPASSKKVKVAAKPAVAAAAPVAAAPTPKPSKKRAAAPAASAPAAAILANLSSQPSEPTIARAVKALVHHVKAHRALNDGKKDTLPGVGREEDSVFLQVTLRNVPDAAIKTFKGRPITLPHSFRPARVHENVCLLVKDKAEARKMLGEDYASNHAQFGVKKMIDLAQLRTRHKSFQAKRELANEYDCFVCDDRIACMLPKTLGKAFYSGTNKRPLPIRFAVKNAKDTLKTKVSKALQSTYLYLSGVSTAVKVGDVDMTEEELVQNLLKCIAGVGELVPRKWAGIQSLYVKSERSAALPLYESK